MRTSQSHSSFPFQHCAQHHQHQHQHHQQHPLVEAQLRDIPSLLERRWNRHMSRLLEMEVSPTQTQVDQSGKAGPSRKVNGVVDQTQQRQRMLPSPPLTESTPEEDRMQGLHLARPAVLTRRGSIPFGTHMNMDLHSWIRCVSSTSNKRYP
jgi:hypothetical protein